MYAVAMPLSTVLDESGIIFHLVTELASLRGRMKRNDSDYGEAAEDVIMALSRRDG
jgi:hypothetical protein